MECRILTNLQQNLYLLCTIVFVVCNGVHNLTGHARNVSVVVAT